MGKTPFWFPSLQCLAKREILGTQVQYWKGHRCVHQEGVWQDTWKIKFDSAEEIIRIRWFWSKYEVSLVWSFIFLFEIWLCVNISLILQHHLSVDFRKYNPTWHCVTGRNFGSYVTHETKHFIYFYLGQVQSQKMMVKGAGKIAGIFGFFFCRFWGYMAIFWVDLRFLYNFILGFLHFCCLHLHFWYQFRPFIWLSYHRTKSSEGVLKPLESW